MHIREIRAALLKLRVHCIEFWKTRAWPPCPRFWHANTIDHSSVYWTIDHSSVYWEVFRRIPEDDKKPYFSRIFESSFSLCQLSSFATCSPRHTRCLQHTHRDTRLQNSKGKKKIRFDDLIIEHVIKHRGPIRFGGNGAACPFTDA
jgi:hypothetical protein